MTDIKILNNRLDIKNNDLTLINGLDEIKQYIIVALNTFYQDWILDSNKGIDYANGLRNLELLEHDVKKQIKEVQGVETVDEFKLSFNRKTLAVNISAHIKSTYGSFDLDEQIQQY